MANPIGWFAKFFKYNAMTPIRYAHKPDEVGISCSGSYILICSEDYLSDKNWGLKILSSRPLSVVFIGGHAELAHDQFDEMVVDGGSPLILTMWFNDNFEGIDELFSVYANTMDLGAEVVIIDPTMKLDKMIKKCLNECM